MESGSDRQDQLQRLAKMLFFRVEQNGPLFTLTRTVDVSNPVRHDGLTIEEAEEILNTWKLRGFHGG